MPTHRIALPMLLVAVLLSVAWAPAPTEQDGPPGTNDFSCVPADDHPRPVVLIHGLGSDALSNWSYHAPSLLAEGYCVFALTYGVDERLEGLGPLARGGTIDMRESSTELAAFVDAVLAATGAEKVDFVGHSEGTSMPRWYLERMGGAEHVHAWVALTPLWRGTTMYGVSQLRDLAAPTGVSGLGVGMFNEFCHACTQALAGSDYLTDLNADGEAIRGIRHTNIVTRYDELVIPYTSGLMRDGGTNVVLQDVCPGNTSEHVAVARDPVVTQMVLNALDPRPDAPITC